MNYFELRALIEQRGCHALLGPVGEGWGIEQHPHELASFLSSIPLPATVLEIGTGYRAGLARFLTYDLGCKVTTVDIQDYGHAAAYPEIDFVLIEWGGVEYPYFQQRFDLVIIDGDHRYDTVRFDADYYGPLGKVVMFHDIAGERDCEGAARFWQEISRNDKGEMKPGYHEVINQGEARAGIGWITR